MDRNLEKQLRILDNKLIQLLEQLKVYSDDQLNRKPSEDKWSVIQNMHHLMLSEDLSLKYVKKKLSFNPELKNKGVLAGVRKTVLNMYLSSPLKRKAPPAISGDNLPDYVTFWDTAKKWKQQREDLKAYFEQLPEEIYKKEVYKHPFAGRLSLTGMIEFFNSHFDRHHKQISRTVKNYTKQN